MKREGKQHGTVSLRSSSSSIKTSSVAADMVVTAGYTKTPTKPTNQSKHTGKCNKARCGQCHTHPVTKSRDKAKGSYKLKSGDVVLNHRLASWRLLAPAPADRNKINIHNWSKYSGVSATGVLDALLTDSCYSQGDDDDDDNDLDHGYGYGDGLIIDEHTDLEERTINNNIEEEGDGEDEDMGFYEVGFVWDCMNEEGWCVVDEM